MKRSFQFLALAVVVCAGCAPALKDLNPTSSATDSGNISFATAGTLARKSDEPKFVMADPVVISGELSFPSGPGPFPAVVLAHGCGGLGNTESAWAPVLRDWGYATFVIDSFSGRGLKEVCTSAGTLTGTQRIPDAYGALESWPRIRRSTLRGSFSWASRTGDSSPWMRPPLGPRKRSRQPGSPVFARSLLSIRSATSPTRNATAFPAPLRIHAGELDDWNPAELCVRLAQQLKGSGQDATVTVYAGAHHSFDNVGYGSPSLYLAGVDSGAKCEFKIPASLDRFRRAARSGMRAQGGNHWMEPGGYRAGAPQRARSTRRATQVAVLDTIFES